MYTRDQVSLQFNGGVLAITFPNGEFYSLNKDDPRYRKAIDAFRRGDYSSQTFGDIMNIRKELVKWGNGKVILDKDDNVVVVHNGAELVVNEALGAELKEYINNGHPVEAFANFVIRLMKNPSMRSRDLFYGFVKLYGMSFTLDGMCRGYKAIKGNWKDKHTGMVDNRLGVTVPRMDRSLVDDDPEKGCSYGLIGAPYSSNWVVIISEKR